MVFITSQVQFERTFKGDNIYKKINILPWIIRIMLTDTFLEQLGH